MLDIRYRILRSIFNSEFRVANSQALLQKNLDVLGGFLGANWVSQSKISKKIQPSKMTLLGRYLYYKASYGRFTDFGILHHGF